MEIWCDTANIATVAQVAALGFTSGVTTNPVILSQPSAAATSLIEKLLEVQDGMVAVQVTKNTDKAIFEQAKRLNALSPERILVKVPTTAEGIKAMAKMTQEGIPTLATAVFSSEQFLIAAKMNVDYVAPYLSFMEKLGLNSIDILAQMQTMIQNYGLATKVMAAALSSLQEINVIAELGIEAITLPESCLQAWLGTHPLTAEAITMFDKPWENYMAKFPDPLFA